MLALKYLHAVVVAVLVVQATACGAEGVKMPEIIKSEKRMPRCLDEVDEQGDYDGLRLLCLRAKRGGAKSQYNMGYIFFRAEGVIENNYVDAFGWYRLAASQNLPVAQYALGLLYLDGLGVTGDFIKANHWIVESAKGGFVDAQYLLGLMYVRGHVGVERSLNYSVVWLSRAARQGHVLSGDALMDVCRIVGVDGVAEAGTRRPHSGVDGVDACIDHFDGMADSSRGSVTNSHAIRKYDSSGWPYVAYTRNDLNSALDRGLDEYINMRYVNLMSNAKKFGADFVN